ncbi:hypothetical protein SBADM41S_00076 [Streptomyces badius]
MSSAALALGEEVSPLRWCAAALLVGGVAGWPGRASDSGPRCPGRSRTPGPAAMTAGIRDRFGGSQPQQVVASGVQQARQLRRPRCQRFSYSQHTHVSGPSSSRHSASGSTPEPSGSGSEVLRGGDVLHLDVAQVGSEHRPGGRGLLTGEPGVQHIPDRADPGVPDRGRRPGRRRVPLGASRGSPAGCSRPCRRRPGPPNRAAGRPSRRPPPAPGRRRRGRPGQGRTQVPGELHQLGQLREDRLVVPLGGHPDIPGESQDLHPARLERLDHVGPFQRREPQVARAPRDGRAAPPPGSRSRRRAGRPRRPASPAPRGWRKRASSCVSFPCADVPLLPAGPVATPARGSVPLRLSRRPAAAAPGYPAASARPRVARPPAWARRGPGAPRPPVPAPG